MEIRREGLTRLMILCLLLIDSLKIHRSSVEGVREGGLQRNDDEVIAKSQPETLTKVESIAFQKKTDPIEAVVPEDRNPSKNQVPVNASKVSSEETPAFL